MKRVVSVFLISLFALSLLAPTPANAGGGNGWVIGGALLGGFLLGSILGPHDRVVVGPVYRHYPRPAYYPPPVVYYLPPVVYGPQPMWIPDHYEWRWRTVCEIMYQRQNCYPAQITVFIPGHWEYR